MTDVPLLTKDERAVHTSRLAGHDASSLVRLILRYEATLQAVERRVKELEQWDRRPFGDEAKRLSAALYKVPTSTGEAALIIIDAAVLLLKQSREIIATERELAETKQRLRQADAVIASGGEDHVDWAREAIARHAASQQGKDSTDGR